MQIRSGEARQVINRLHWLRRKISQTGTQGFKSRVEFLCLAFRHELDADIRHYRLWDEGWEDLVTNKLTLDRFCEDWRTKLMCTSGPCPRLGAGGFLKRCWQARAVSGQKPARTQPLPRPMVLSFPFWFRLVRLR